MTDTPVTDRYSIEPLLPHIQEWWNTATDQPGVDPSLLICAISPEHTEQGQLSIIKVVGTDKFSAIDTCLFTMQLSFRSLLRMLFDEAKKAGNEQSVNLPGVIVTVCSLMLEGINIPNTVPFFSKAITDIFSAKIAEQVEKSALSQPEAEEIERVGDPEPEQ